MRVKITPFSKPLIIHEAWFVWEVRSDTRNEDFLRFQNTSKFLKKYSVLSCIFNSSRRKSSNSCLNYYTQTLACQLSSTLIQLLFSFDQDMRVEKTSFIQTLACQLPSTLIQLLFSFGEDMRIDKIVIKNYRLSTHIKAHATLVSV